MDSTIFFLRYDNSQIGIAARAIGDLEKIIKDQVKSHLRVSTPSDTLLLSRNRGGASRRLGFHCYNERSLTAKTALKMTAPS